MILIGTCSYDVIDDNWLGLQTGTTTRKKKVVREFKWLDEQNKTSAWYVTPDLQLVLLKMTPQFDTKENNSLLFQNGNVDSLLFSCFYDANCFVNLKLLTMTK